MEVPPLHYKPQPYIYKLSAPRWRPPAPLTPQFNQTSAPRAMAPSFTSHVLPAVGPATCPTFPLCTAQLHPQGPPGFPSKCFSKKWCLFVFFFQRVEDFTAKPTLQGLGSTAASPPGLQDSDAAAFNSASCIGGKPKGSTPETWNPKVETII